MESNVIGALAVLIMTNGPLNEQQKLGPSEYDDDDLGWAGKGDLGQSKGRVLSGGARGAPSTRDAPRPSGVGFLKERGYLHEGGTMQERFAHFIGNS